MARSTWMRILVLLLVAGSVPVAWAAPAGGGGGDHGEGHASLGQILPLWSVIPFAGMLLSIAVFPLVAPRFWHRHYPKVAAAWAVIFAVPFLAAYGGDALHEIAHIMVADYIPFIILLWGLFTVSGGIALRGVLPGTPRVNTALLAFGTAIASWVGTTGAAMLLIRPVLRANAHRKRKVHVVVFFIFLVANIGGSLTPLGDPPLLLGFLHGVPFFWTMKILPDTLFVAGTLLVIFYFMDRRLYRLEGSPAAAATANGEKLRVDGLFNLGFLGAIVGAVLLSGVWKTEPFHLWGLEMRTPDLVRNGLIVVIALSAYFLTPAEYRRANEFSWEPIREVAYLFFGIFVTIIPALAILRAGESGHLAFLIRAVREPWQYFWVTGALSSFLDNAPTYLTFFNTQLGRFYPGMPEAQAVARLIHEKVVYLEAISAGAVFMGANTYIGNAPNFMVKAIAEEAGVAMPSFFGYLFRWSVPILIPVFLVSTWIFFV